MMKQQAMSAARLLKCAVLVKPGVRALHVVRAEPARLLPERAGSLALFSLSNSICHNLAYESYLAEALNKQRDRNVLLMWISEPCVVVGRHQNPWLESDLVESARRSVRIVRRYSGGGCVYHDLGNLNISFLTDRARYDRQSNLRLIKEALDESGAFAGVEFEISPRHDIFLRRLGPESQDSQTLFKLSGSAARLAQNFSYHHCTLLFDAAMENMKLLRSNLEAKITTKATRSVRAKCLNLKTFVRKDSSLSSSVDLDFMVKRLAEHYWRRHHSVWALEHLFSYVNPETDAQIAELIAPSVRELESWDYVFGSTPRFQLTADLDAAKVVFTVESGVISANAISSDGDDKVSESIRRALDSFVGVKLRRHDLDGVFQHHSSLVNTNSHFKQLQSFLNKNLV